MNKRFRKYSREGVDFRYSRVEERVEVSMSEVQLER